MKDFSKEEYEDTEPSSDLGEIIDFCLGRLYVDDQHVATDSVVRGLSFEELIGALVKAKHYLQREERLQRIAEEHEEDGPTLAEAMKLVICPACKNAPLVVKGIRA